jgi:UDP-GlcNAc:undecaprenyl-phosphate GlcNAc-1-phosphate transferase
MSSLGPDVYVLVFALAAAVAWALTALLPLRALARPAEARIGRRRVGGLAVFAGLLVALLLATLVSSDLADLIDADRKQTAGLLGAGVMVLAVGLLDDLREVNFKVKFAVQIAAAGLAFLVGYRIEDVSMPWGASFSLEWAAPIVTILWLVLLSNAINLIDGKDGLAAGAAIIAALPLALIAHNVDRPLVAIEFVALAGACAGFLPLNLPRASRLLGDSGVLLIGFLLAALAIEGSTGVTNRVFVSVPIVALGYPILDTALSFTRRIIDLRHPFLRDVDHIHHRLEGTGLSDSGVLFVLYALCLLFAGAALTIHFVEAVAAEFLAFFAYFAAILLVIFGLGYARSMWRATVVQSMRGLVTGVVGGRRTGPRE